MPTTPPPSTTTFAGATPGTPPSRMPRPIIGFSRYFAPSWMLIFPAISLIGVRQGSRPALSLIVSYAIATISALQARLRQLRAGGEMKICENDLPRPKQADLLRLRFLHLDDHVRLATNTSFVRRQQLLRRPST